MAVYSNMNVFSDIPLETPQSAYLPMLPMRCSFSKVRHSDTESPRTRREPTYHSDVQWRTQIWSNDDKENCHPHEHIDGSVLSRISPLEALPLDIKSLEDHCALSEGDGYIMDVDDFLSSSGSESSATSSVKDTPTLREKRLLSKSPHLKDLQIYVPPTHSEYLPASSVVVGSSDFVVWVDALVSSLYTIPLFAAEARRCLLAVANNPTEEGFQAAYALIRDPYLIEEFTDRLALHVIHFSDEESNSDGLRSAWSDSACSECSDEGTSPSDVALDVLRSIDDAIDELSALTSTFPVFSDEQLEEVDITDIYDSPFL